MKKLITFVAALMLTVAAIAQTPDNTVEVVYNGTTATVSVASNVTQYLTVTQSGAHVSIAQSDSLATEITYNLSGTSTDGEFYMSGSYKATIELDGLTLTNATPVYSGAAVHIQNGKRINVKVITGTTNTLVDAASGSQKGCLYVKGHAEFKQYGTLSVVGNVKHGIKAGEYISLKNATINVTSAVGDGISCNQYFLMESGTINISGTADDGIQCDLDGDTSTGETTDHEDEDSGNMYISGGTINVTCTAAAAKGIKCVGTMYITGGDITVNTTGDGTWDEDDLETKAACGLSSDANINISGGTFSLTATGSGGKGMKCDSVLTISDGTITVVTSGGLYYNNGTTENTNYTGNTDNVSSDYYSSPKGIKVGVKTQSGNSYIYSGGLVISGGNIKVTTSGYNAEGIESKNTLNITGGEVFINAYDDGINSGQDMTIAGGYVYSRSTNNDGIDANGNGYLNGGLVYAIGASSPEVAIDVNSEENKQLYVNGGTVIAVGGLEQGSNLNQATYQASSVSSNTWYSITYGSHAVAFYTPTVSSGGGPGGGGPGGGGPGGGGPGGGSSSGLIISTPSTPTLTSGVTVNGGTSIFEDNCYLDATVSGGSSVTLSYLGGETSIDDIETEGFTIRSQHGNIVVEGCDNCEVNIFDMAGRRVSDRGLSSGIYIVKIGDRFTKKVAVTR
ncbi:MAG: carbohydrate-binding domain-containing protein [Bacteroidales bacterium]|nr:carbohydrate-binding domain-containing protein [Bacteroidales bacterium]